jgi:hypothetical protein
LRSISRQISLFIAVLTAAGLLFAISPAGLAKPAEPDQPAVSFAAAQFLLESAWLVPGEDGGAPRLAAGPGPAGALERLYTARFRHPGVVKARGLQVTVEIPAGMLYVAGSAIGPGAEISYSVDDGESFVPRAELRDATDATHIRWRLEGEFLPGTAGLVSFRARPADTDVEADVEADIAPAAEAEADAEADAEAAGEADVEAGADRTAGESRP